jgi:hypothetical protein
MNSISKSIKSINLEPSQPISGLSDRHFNENPEYSEDTLVERKGLNSLLDFQLARTREPYNYGIPPYPKTHSPRTLNPSFGNNFAPPPKAEQNIAQRTTAPITTAGNVQAVKNMLATNMANDIKESPQKAIDKGAVSKEGKVTPNKLEPAVQKELESLIKDFRNHSADFSKQIEKLAKNINEDGEFKTAYNDFKDKYDKNFSEEKDLFKEGFNAKEVVDSFDIAFEASKGTSHEKEMKDIKENIIDKYIRPMDNLARGDQGTALVGRDKLLDSASKSADGLNNEKLSLAFDKFKKTIGEKGDLKQATKDLKDQISVLKKDSNFSPEQKAELDKIDKATSTAGQLHQIAYAGVKDNNGKAELDTSKLDFDHKQTSKDFFDYMHQNHREDIKPTLERMNEQSGNLTPEELDNAGTNIEYKDSDIKTIETPDEKIGSVTEPTDQNTNLASAEKSFPDDEPEIPEPEIQQEYIA